MSSLYLLVPLSLLLTVGAITALIWAIRRGQYDHLERRMPDDET